MIRESNDFFSSQEGVQRQILLSTLIKLVQMIAPLTCNVKRVGPTLGCDIYSLQNEFTWSLWASISNKPKSLSCYAFSNTSFTNHSTITLYAECYFSTWNRYKIML